MTNIYSGPVAPLLESLKALKRIVGTRNNIPILHCAIIRPDHKGRATIMATDLDTELSFILPGTKAARPFVVPVVALLNGLSGETGLVTMEYRQPANHDDDYGEVDVTVGDLTFTLHSLPAVDFPNDLVVPSTTAGAEMSTAHLRDMLDKVQFAISTEETRYYLNGIYVHASAEPSTATALRFVATDGHKLSLAEAPAHEWTGEGMILPRTAIDHLMQLLKDKGDVQITGHAPTGMRFRAGDWTLTTKVIDGTFPDYTRVLPHNAHNRVEVDTGAALAACRKLAKLSSERSRAIAIDPAEGVFRIAVPNDGQSMGGRVKVQMDRIEGRLPVIGFNAAYLVSILERMGDRATLAVAGDGDPMTVTPMKPPVWGDLLTVVMPMRV